MNVWEEPRPCEEKRTWPRLRRLAPLAVVVGLLLLAVGVADLVIHYPRPRSASRETSRNGKTLPDTKIQPGEDGAHPAVREPLVLPGATSGQTAVATVVNPEAPAPGGGGDFGAAHDPSQGLGGAAGRQDVAALDAKSGGGPPGEAANKEAAAKTATASGQFGGVGSVQVRAGLSDAGTAHSGGGRDEGRGDVPGGAASEAPKAASGASKPSAPGGTVAGKPVDAADRGGLGASPDLAGKGGNPVSASAQPQQQRREPSLEPAQSLSSPPAEPPPPARDAQAAVPPPANGDAAMADLRDVEGRLETFLASYVRDYSRRDLQGFMRHFAPSALENGTPLEALHALYEENFRNIPTMRYSIMVDTMSVDAGRVRFAGRFELRGFHADGQPIASRGTLNMDLEPFETTFRVRSLDYSFR